MIRARGRCRKGIILALFSFAFLFNLTACSKVDNPNTTKTAPLATPYHLPSEAYLGLANRQVGDERNALMLMAAGRAIYDGQWQQASIWLKELNDLTPIQSAEKSVLLAKIAMLRQSPSLAMAELSRVKQVEILPLFYQVEYHEMLAHAYYLNGKLAEAVGERLILDNLLPSLDEKNRNRRMMWLTLTKMPDAELNTILTEWSPSRVWQGWLKLALIAKNTKNSPERLLKQLEAWQEEFPNHPAYSLLPPSLKTGQLMLYPTPHQVALLLPMTGPLSGPGTAVYDGFMAGLQQSGRADKLSVKVYDTAKFSADKLYEKAVAEGADFVIGPLTKSDVAEVARLTHPVPTILLNEADSVTQGAYSLSLSPVAEAAQVAMKAREEGYRRALVIAPKTPWGEEVLSGFSSAWRARKGMIVDTLRYDNTTTLSQGVRDLLQYYESVDSQRHDKKKIGSRRQDFDMIFLVAYPSVAREIVPLLRYYYAGNERIFSISTVYAGTQDIKLNRDLDGVVFCDMPFVFKETLPNKHWPEPLNSYSRLFALGLDGFALTHQLNALLLFPALGVDDKTGVLYLNQSNQLVRLLAWGQFKQGQAVLLSGG